MSFIESYMTKLKS